MPNPSTTPQWLRYRRLPLQNCCGFDYPAATFTPVYTSERSARDHKWLRRSSPLRKSFFGIPVQDAIRRSGGAGMSDSLVDLFLAAAQQINLPGLLTRRPRN